MKIDGPRGGRRRAFVLGSLLLSLAMLAGCGSNGAGGAGGGAGTLKRGAGGGGAGPATADGGSDRLDAGAVGGGAGGSGAGGGGAGGATIADAGPAETTPSSPSCGGTVHTTSTGVFSLDAHYVELRYTGGDCSDILNIVVAETLPGESLTITMPVPMNRMTRSFVGRSTVVATFAETDGVMNQTGADVDITSVGPDATKGADAGGGAITGTFSIAFAGGTIEGSFSSPICSLAICI